EADPRGAKTTRDGQTIVAVGPQPDAATQGAILNKEAAPQERRRRHRIFGDRALVPVQVRASGAGRNGIEFDSVEPGACYLHEAKGMGGLGVGAREPWSDEDLDALEPAASSRFDPSQLIVRQPPLDLR